MFITSFVVVLEGGQTSEIALRTSCQLNEDLLEEVKMLE
jgi:hypothetical protein